MVLLILAGVSINLILDENGIIKKSKDARRKTVESAQNEQDMIDKLLDDMNDTVPEWGGTTTELPEFKLNDSTNKFDWYIYNEPQMKFFANFVNQTLTEQDEKLMTDSNVTSEDIAITGETTIYLMNDLDLGARFDENGNLTWGVKWEPIGPRGKELLGVFEGNNHYVKGVYVDSNIIYSGLFATTNTIRNLTIKDSYITGTDCVGGIVGGIDKGTIENCHNINTTVVLKENGVSVAGIAGQGKADKIVGCTNRGTIYAYGRDEKDRTQAGGIVGIGIGKEISNCVNKGNIILGEGSGLYTGGICGITDATNEVIISNCINEGEINGAAGVGGIVGLLSTNGIVEKCSNIGNVNAENSAAAGIVAHANQKNMKSNSIVRECYNSGNITGKKMLGGIVAYFCGQSQQGTVENCYSKGTIIATEGDSGAIVGKKVQEDGNAVFRNLYYLNTIGLYAINNNQSFESETVKAVEDDIKTYEEFLEWIKTKQ